VAGPLFIGRSQTPQTPSTAVIVNTATALGAVDIESNGSAGITHDLVTIKHINGSDVGNALTITGRTKTTDNALLVQNANTALDSQSVITRIRNVNTTDAVGSTLLRLETSGTNQQLIRSIISTGGIAGFGTTSPTPTSRYSRTMEQRRVPLLSWPHQQIR
jgi:hypothetical protein